MTNSRSLARLATLGIVLGLATPALAAPKPVKITMPASAVADPTRKLCMPRTLTGAKRDKSLPETLCQTRDEWATAGVMIVAK